MPLVFVIALAATLIDADLAAVRAADARLVNVAHRLQSANVALCPKVQALPGFVVQARSQYAAADRARVGLQLGLGDTPVVAAVAAGSGAARAGLAVGDTIVAVDGSATPTANAAARYDQIAATEAQIDVAFSDRLATLRIARAGSTREIVVAGNLGCASRVQLIPGSRALNSAADGTYVQITGGMIDFAATDDALAVVTAHELAHNILGHRDRLDAEQVSRGLFAGLGRDGARLRAVEDEADRLGVWLMAGAGYDIAAAQPFWSSLARRSAPDFLSDGTHAGWRGRIARVVAAVAEVRAQHAAGMPLVPPELAASQARKPR